MTPAAPTNNELASQREPLRRLHASLVLLALAGSVALTALCVARPVQSARAHSSTAAAAATADFDRLPAGVRIEVRGGDALDAYRLADRLTASGAVIGRVVPAADREPPGAGTTILYYQRSQLPTADRIRRMLGRGTLQRSELFQPVVDVTIVLGKDLSRA